MLYRCTTTCNYLPISIGLQQIFIVTLSFHVLNLNEHLGSESTVWEFSDALGEWCAILQAKGGYDVDI